MNLDFKAIAFPLFFVLVFAAGNRGIGQTDAINKLDEQGRKHGFWQKKNEEGMIKYEGAFKHGTPSGKFKYYYPGGNTRAITYFSDSGNIARTKTFHKNGKVMAQGKYVNERKDSTWLFYDPFGNISLSEDYRDGVKHGKAIHYYDDGTIAEESNWKEGVKHGTSKSYFPGETLKMKANYNKGKLSGQVLFYNTRGRPKINGFYKKSLKEGIWTYYDDSGEVVKLIEYESGTPLRIDSTGTWQEYIRQPVSIDTLR